MSAGRRRTFTALGVVLVALVLVFFLGGGWYFAGQIQSDGLTPEPDAPPEYDLTVAAYDDRRVTLREDEPPEQTLRNPGLFGLQWPGGYGLLGFDSSVGEDGVVRTLRVVRGNPPAAGLRAALEDNYYDGDPQSALGIPFQEVPVACPVGPCPAWQVPGTRDTWAVLVHGKGDSQEEMLRPVSAVRAAGLPALLISYRNDRGVVKDPSGYYRYGRTEWQDVEAAVRYAQGRGARRFVLFGDSMGGGIVASFLRHSKLAKTVSAVVLDSPMLDFRKTVEFGASQRRVAGLPLPPPLTWTAELIAAWRFDIDWAEIDYLEDDWLRVPALVFQGTDDKRVPPDVTAEFAALHPDLVQEVRIEGAGHVDGWNVDPQSYNANLSAFLKRVLG